MVNCIAPDLPADSHHQAAMTPAFFNARYAPFLLIVLSPRAVTRIRTNFLISGTQMRCSCRLGGNSRRTFLVTCRPTPPFFFAIPRRWMTLPRVTRDPVILQILDIDGKGRLTHSPEFEWGVRCDATPRRSSDSS